MEASLQHQCPDCQKIYSKLISLSLHFRKTHHKTAKDLIVALNYNNVVPTCKCGCGQETKFLDIGRGFNDFIRGHSSKIKNNWGHNKEALLKSQEKRKDMWENGELKAWRKGLTKETDERVALSGKRGSETIQNNQEELQKRSERLRENRLNGKVPTLYGSEHSQWKGGCSPLIAICHSNTRLFKEWKYPKLVASGFKCEKCEAPSKEHLHVHHNKEHMAEIIHKIAFECGWSEKQFASRKETDVETSELKLTISNKVADYHITNNVSGIVLCESCHKNEHNKLNFHN